MILLAPVSLPNDHDFLFYSITQVNLTLFTQIVDHITTKYLVKNTFDCMLHILWHQKLSHIVDICYDNYFLINAQVALDFATFPPRAQPFFDLDASIALAPSGAPMEIQLENGIRVYKNATAIKEIFQLVAKCSFIWKLEGFVRIFPKHWINVPLKPR